MAVPSAERVAEWAIEDAMRRVMDIDGGNLDHPALDHLERAIVAVKEATPNGSRARSGEGT